MDHAEAQYNGYSWVWIDGSRFVQLIGLRNKDKSHVVFAFRTSCVNVVNRINAITHKLSIFWN